MRITIWLFIKAVRNALVVWYAVSMKSLTGICWNQNFLVSKGMLILEW